MILDNTIQRVLQCYHCGNKTLMNLIGEHKEYWDEGKEYKGIEHHQMYVCPICKEITLLGEVWQEANGTINSGKLEEVLYPICSFNSIGIPETVSAAYESALKTKNIDAAVCLIALRRTLEIICKDMNATGSTLWHKIEDLSQKGILPSSLRHASTLTKTFGNIGAHDSIIGISQSDVVQVIEFVRYIIDYLYVLPAKLNIVQEKLGRIIGDKAK